MFEHITYEIIRDRMLARVSDKLDKREGSVIWDTHSPTAIELQILYLELDSILREAYGDTASREFLILRCKERGLSPYPATKAVLKGKFTPTDVDVTRKRFNIGRINYVVTEKIVDGEYQVQCEKTGEIGNRYLGEMVPIDYISGLQTAELTEVLIPGEEEEDTEDLRGRYFASFAEKAFGGNVADYIEKTNAVPGVGRTKVTSVWNGDISPFAMIPSEGVTAWYENIIGTLEGDPAAWLTTVYTAAAEKKLTTGGTVLLTIVDSQYGTASDTLIRAVQDAVDPADHAGDGYGFAPIGHVVTVKSAEAVPVSVETTVTCEVGYDRNGLQSVMEETVTGYLMELRKAWADRPYLVVRVSQIESRLLNIPGIVDVENTRINGAEGNLTLDSFVIPVFGGVSG